GVIPGVRSVAEAEQLDGLVGNPAFGEVIAGDLASGIGGQSGLPAVADLLMHLEQGVLEGAGLLVAGGILEFEGDVRAVGEAFDGVDEGKAFVFANEGKDVASLVTAEAMKD